MVREIRKHGTDCLMRRFFRIHRVITMKRGVKMTAKKLLALILVLALLPVCCPAESITMGRLLSDLVLAYENPDQVDIAMIDAEVEALGDEIAAAVAEHWKKVYLDPDYHLLYSGTDSADLLEIPDPAHHAFAVLGYQLKDGEMTAELIGRCDAAAEAARAFPEAILVCTGGATGANNPEGHTEAVLMKDYLVSCGIDAARIFTDEKAMTTVENAQNTFRILQEQGIRTMTVITSGYHQRWGQALYNAVGAQWKQQEGYAVEIIGNYCFYIETSNGMYRRDDRIAAMQLAQILKLPMEENAELQLRINGIFPSKPGNTEEGTENRQGENQK